MFFILERIVTVDNLSIEFISFIFTAGFFASFIDSIVGGGGLISIPALLMTGMPISTVLGTNKLGATMGATASVISYMKSGKVNFQLVKWLFPLSFIGSIGGVELVRRIPPEFLKPLIVVLLVAVTVYTLVKKDWGNESTYKGMNRKAAFLSGLVAFGIGFYDGFFGPGTGSFLIFAFLMIGFDFVTASGNAKVLNFASNIAAMMAFIWIGEVNYTIAFTMGGGMILGAITGSRLAIRKGTAYVRPIFILVTVLLIGKQVADLVMKHLAAG